MTTTHALKFNAAPYTAEGELVHPDDTGITRGPGRGKCACGALSPELENGAQRRNWFKEHKANPESWTRTDVSIEVVEVEDDVPLDPEPATEPGVIPLEELKSTVEASLELYKVSRVLPFEKTKDLAAHFWRFLGRDGVRRLADSGVLGKVRVTTNAQDHTIRISGADEADVDEAIKLIKRYWAEAVETGKEWKKTDPTWLARPRGGLAMRKASFHMMGAYYLEYADTFIESVQDSLI